MKNQRGNNDGDINQYSDGPLSGRRVNSPSQKNRNSNEERIEVMIVIGFHNPDLKYMQIPAMT